MVAVAITKDGVQWDALVHVRVHPAAELFPSMKGKDFEELVADIRENGLHEAIVFTPDGQLLDGRNRYRACKKIRNEEPRTRIEHSEPWAYVISANLHRRHLSENQRALIGGKLADRARGGSDKITLKSPNGEMRTINKPPTQKQAADLLNVSKQSLWRARQVVQHGIKGLQQLVDEDKVSLHAAVEVASKFNKDEQEQWVRDVRAGAVTTARPRLRAVPDASPQPVAPARGHIHRSPRRHQYVQATAAQRLIESLEGLRIVLDTAPDGLDPSVTAEEASRLSRGLSKEAAAHRRLLALLKQRAQENTQ